MVREAENEQSAAMEDAPADFLGRDYNLTIWRPTRSERAFFRNEGPRVGMMAPDFTLPSLDGGMVSLEEMRGMPVVLELGSMT